MSGRVLRMMLPVRMHWWRPHRTPRLAAPLSPSRLQVMAASMRGRGMGCAVSSDRCAAETMGTRCEKPEGHDGPHEGALVSIVGDRVAWWETKWIRPATVGWRVNAVRGVDGG